MAKRRVLITLDGSIYSFMKERRLKISSEINRLLKVAYSDGFSPKVLSKPDVKGSNPFRPITIFLVIQPSVFYLPNPKLKVLLWSNSIP